MRSGDNYKVIGKMKKCEYCGTLFTSRSKKSRFCSADCREAEEARLKEERARIRQNAAFEPVFAYINRFYKETGILLSYGKAVARMQVERDAEKRRRQKEQVEKKNERIPSEEKQSVLAP